MRFMTRSIHVEIFTEGRWQHAAEVRLRRGESRSEPTSFEYELDYALAHVDERGLESVSVRLPVSFELQDLPTFPSFCVDLMPQGIPRRRLERRLTDEGLAPSDWGVLRRGAGSPIGNLRVAEAAHQPVERTHGVPRSEVVSRGERFGAWAEDAGIPMQGANDTAGVSPKLLLTEDEHGLLHADGALADARARRHWMVKFPRGRSARDQLVLACEAAWLEVARRLGLRCGDPLTHDQGALFVPRFDRLVTEHGVHRLGLESVYSLLGVVQAGAALRWEDVCAAVAGTVDAPEGDIIEIVARDAVSLALGDTDNHGRNTSILKAPSGSAVSPLYDFAPMFLDSEGISRQTRWDSERSPGGPDWAAVIASVSTWVDPASLSARLLTLAADLGSVREWLRGLGVEDEVIEAVAPRVAWVARSLRTLEG